MKKPTNPESIIQVKLWDSRSGLCLASLEGAVNAIITTDNEQHNYFPNKLLYFLKLFP